MTQAIADLRSRLGVQRRLFTPVWREVLVLAGICAFLFFYGLGSFGLVGADEPRYAQIAREMLERHDWVVPMLNGKPWLEKPVFYYWQAMMSYRVFGVSDWAARVPVALDAVAMIAAVYLFARRFRPGVQLDAALIAASCAAVIGFGRAASTDMPLTAMFTIAMLGWLAWYETAGAKFLAIFYAFLAFATLAKGPVAPFLAGAILILFTIIRRNWHVIPRTLWWPGILLYFAIAAPWFIAVQLHVPEFFRIFILEHNLARYDSNLFQHHQPLWYYGPVLLLSVLPWLVLVLAGFVRTVSRESTVADFAASFCRVVAFGDDVRRDHAIAGLLLVWAVFPVVFFTASGSKLPGYILPAIPAWSLLVTEWLYRKHARDERPNCLLMSVHTLLASTLMGGALLCQYAIYRIRPTEQAYVVAGIVTAILFVVTTALVLMRGLRVLRVVTLIPVILGLAFVVKVGGPAIDATQSARPVAADVRKLVPDSSLPVAGFHIRRELEYGLNYYLNQPIPLYDRGDVPAERHIVVTRASEQDVEKEAKGRQVVLLGRFAPQQVDIYMVEQK